MQQEAPQKLLRGEPHHSPLAAVSIVLPKEGDFSVGKVDDAVIGDGNAVSVACQVLENMLWATEWWFGINDPVVAKQSAKKGVEGFLLHQRFEPAGQAEFAFLESLLESRHELAAKHTATRRGR